MATQEMMNSDSQRPGKRLLVLRHGERCDFTFGRSWITNCFDDKGVYSPVDLNLPSTMIPRDSPRDFLNDSPLTETGHLQARLTGEAMKKQGVNIQHIYASPALRCVQTAQGVIDGFGNKELMMKLEPSAFEWFGWYRHCLPTWLSTQEMKDAGLNVDTQHIGQLALKDINIDETLNDYYERCHKLVKSILQKHQNDSGDILIVAHAGSLDTFTRQLVGKQARTTQQIERMLGHFSYCCLCCCTEVKAQTWKLTAPPIPPINEFDWQVML